MVSREPYHVDPEVDALLREIAADPRSGLFKVSGPRSTMSWADCAEPLSARALDLSAAERQLVQVHRLDLAQLLRSRWLLELQAHPVGHLHVVVGSGNPCEAPSREHWTTRAEEQRAQDLELGRQCGSELLERFPVGAAVNTCDLSLLVATAMRLDPSNPSRLYLAQDLIRKQEISAASALLAKVHELEPGGTNTPFALDGLAQVENLRGHLDEARELYRRSAALDGSRVNALGGWLLLCVQTGRDDMALAAAGEIDGADKDRGPGFQLLARETLRMRRSGAWKPTLAAGELARTLRDSAGENAGKVLDVFL